MSRETAKPKTFPTWALSYVIASGILCAGMALIFTVLSSLEAPRPPYSGQSPYDTTMLPLMFVGFLPVLLIYRRKRDLLRSSIAVFFLYFLGFGLLFCTSQGFWSFKGLCLWVGDSLMAVGCNILMYRVYRLINTPGKDQPTL